MVKVSVLMSTYREPIEWIKAAVESVLIQSLTDFEFIILVDDPNNKEIIKYLESIQDTRVKIVVNESNLGLVQSLNKGLTLCKSDFIARMDADDISLPTRLESQYKFLETYNYDLCGSWYELFYDKNTIRISKPPKLSDVCIKVLRYESCVAHPSWMVRKEVYDYLDGYRNMDAVEDYDFLIRAAEANYKMGNVQEVLLRYRDNQNSISHKKSITQELNKIYLSEKYRKGHFVSEHDFSMFINSETYQKYINELEENQTLQHTIASEINIFKTLCIAIKLAKSKLFISRKIERQIVKSLKIIGRFTE